MKPYQDTPGGKTSDTLPTEEGTIFCRPLPGNLLNVHAHLFQKRFDQGRTGRTIYYGPGLGKARVWTG